MAAVTKIIDFHGPGAFPLTTATPGSTHSLLMLAVTNLGGIAFQIEDSEAGQLTGPIILGDLQQFTTNFGTVAVPLAAAPEGRGIQCRVKTGGRLTGFAVVDE